VEPIRPGQEECAATLRLLGRLLRIYGVRFFEAVTADAWHSQGPFLRAVQRLGWEGTVVLKDERREVYQEAQQLSRDPEPSVAFEDPERDRLVELWEMKDLDFCERYGGMVRVVGSRSNGPKSGHCYHHEPHSDVGADVHLDFGFYPLHRLCLTAQPIAALGSRDPQGTGTGKELIAQAIHRMSPRQGRLIVKVNGAALPSALVESELFGREKGAFTGALTRQVGRFEIADGSTIFLDEIGELSLEVQAKLLRVLQEGQFERLGSPKTIPG
jgi:hypothetical protein